jgi:hypothetical protein
MIDKKLLAILACPACKADISYDEKTDTIRCTRCARIYPIKDGIPIMLVEESKQG